jgi:outer membrane receptor protein involved in Fe transport
LSGVAVLVSQLCIARLAAAQQTPTTGETRPSDAPLAGQPSSEAQLAAPPPADATPATATPPTTSGKLRAAEEQITVTGSRIRRKDLTTPAPIAVISKQEIQASGKVSIGDFLQGLPEQGNAINTTFNNGGNGSTRISLRGLGAARTLVLLNGRRFVAGGNGADSSVDLNSIPSAAIERIEVLKDGASAIYGSDAIGGVVNLITRRRFNGTEVAGYAGTSTHVDGTVYDLSGTSGRTGDAGSILFSVGYYTQKPVFAGDRDFSKLPWQYDSRGTNTPNRLPGQFAVGSPTIPEGTFDIPANQAGTALPNPTNDPRLAFYNRLVTSPLPGYNTATKFVRDPTAPICLAGSPGQCWRPYTSSNLPPNGDGYNFQPLNYLVTPQQRVSLFTIGEAKIGNSARAYFEGSFVVRRSEQKLAAEPLNLDGERITVSATNFYNPFGRPFFVSGSNVGPTDRTPPGFVRKRLEEFGERRFGQEIFTYRVVTGVDGTLPESTGIFQGWFWDASFNYGRTVTSNTKQGNLKLPGLQAALGPSWVDSGGVPRCGTSQATNIPGCVPLNMFGGPGSITAEQISGLTFTGTSRGTNELAAVQFNTSGELFKLFAERPVGLAAGYEYRIVAGESIPDPITVAGETTGNKGDITRGHYYVNEGYGELSIPIVDHLPAAEAIEATAALRVFNYSNFGSDATYKFGGRWSIIRDVTLRGTYSTGFRAPSIGDLYQGLADGFPSISDPCAGRNPLVQGTCGPAWGNGDNQTQLRSQSGGNPALKPETAKIFTIGTVLEPSFVKNLAVTVDYYHIRLEQTIGTIGASTILSGCYSRGISAYCDLVTRDPTTFRISNIRNQFQNVGSNLTDGIDVSVNYNLPTPAGRFAFIFDGTWLHRYNRTLATGQLVKGRNNYDLGVYPAFKFISGVRWNYEGLLVGFNTRFTGSYYECGNAAGVYAGAGQCFVNAMDKRIVRPYNAYDVFVTYNFTTTFGRTTVSGGVNNLFDRQPPFVYNAGNSFGASDPSAYPDAYLGRFGYVRIAQNF